MQIVSEGPIRITRAIIEAAWRREADRRVIIRDAECRGLALIVNATTITWSYAYRPRGIDPLTGRGWPNRTVTLGNPASSSPDEARTEANKLKGQATGAAPLAPQPIDRPVPQAPEGAEQTASVAVPPQLIELLKTLPPHVDRRNGAAQVSQHFFRVSHRTLEGWSLPTRHVNKGGRPAKHLGMQWTGANPLSHTPDGPKDYVGY